MHNLYSLRDQLDTDENNVDAIEERLYLISRLKRKYNRDEDGLIAFSSIKAFSLRLIDSEDAKVIAR